MLDRLSLLEDEFREVETRLGDPAILNDQRKLATMARRHKVLDAIVSRSTELRAAYDDLHSFREMLTDSGGDDREMMRDEIRSTIRLEPS